MVETEVTGLTVNGLVKAGILSEGDRENIASTWLKKIDFAYPAPTLERDDSLREIQLFLGNNQIYSRGRFGAWKYEIGNMDHSVMMGVEVVNRILCSEKENVWR